VRLRDASKTGSHRDARREQPCAFLSAFFVCLVVALQCAAHSHVETPMLRVNAFCFADAAGDCGDGFLSDARGDEQKADFYGEEAAPYFKICIRLQISAPFT
jgi:hypothetical protein